MFYSVNKVIDDWRRIRMGGVAEEDVHEMGVEEDDARDSWIRLSIQAILTVFVLGLCVWVVTNPSSAEGADRLAHLGFGSVLGYWLR